MTLDLDKLEALAKAAPQGKWEIWTSCSWRRIYADQGREKVRVIEPTTQHDRWPDLAFGSGVEAWMEGFTPEVALALIAEVRALRELAARIPATPEAMIDFIGPHFGSIEAQGWESDLSTPTGDLSAVRYSLTVHDLLSAFDWADLTPDAIDAVRKEKA